MQIEQNNHPVVYKCEISPLHLPGMRNCIHNTFF